MAGSSLEDQPYFHGKLVKSKAEAALAAAGLKDGQFLVRSKGADFILSLTFRGKGTHHLMEFNEAGTVLLNKKDFGGFTSIPDLIEHLKSPVKGWPCILNEAVPSAQAATQPQPAESDAKADDKPESSVSTTADTANEPKGDEDSSKPAQSQENDPKPVVPQRKGEKSSGEAKQTKPSYLHGAIGKAEADGILEKAGMDDGTFFFRLRKEGNDNELILSVAFRGKGTHHLVKRLSPGDDYEVNTKGTGAKTLPGVVDFLKEKRPWWPVPLKKPVPAANTPSRGEPDSKPSEDGAKATSSTTAQDAQSKSESATPAASKAPSPPPLQPRAAESTPSSEDKPAHIEPSYLHGPISKAAADELLQKAGLTDGTFLVRRRKEGSMEELIVSVVYRGKGTHHLLKRASQSEPYTINNKPTGKTDLEDVVEFLKVKHSFWPVPLAKPVAASASGEGDKGATVKEAKRASEAQTHPEPAAASSAAGTSEADSKSGSERDDSSPTATTSDAGMTKAPVSDESQATPVSAETERRAAEQMHATGGQACKEGPAAPVQAHSASSAAITTAAATTETKPSNGETQVTEQDLARQAALKLQTDVVNFESVAKSMFDDNAGSKAKPQSSGAPAWLLPDPTISDSQKTTLYARADQILLDWFPEQDEDDGYIEISDTPEPSEEAKDFVARFTPYYHGNMKKGQAVSLLESSGLQDGAFLLRDKPKGQRGDEFVLSVAFANTVTHHLVARPAVGRPFCVNGTEIPTAPTLAQVVSHLRTKRPFWPVPLSDGIMSMQAVALEKQAEAASRRQSLQQELERKRLNEQQYAAEAWKRLFGRSHVAQRKQTIAERREAEPDVIKKLRRMLTDIDHLTGRLKTAIRRDRVALEAERQRKQRAMELFKPVKFKRSDIKRLERTKSVSSSGSQAQQSTAAAASPAKRTAASATKAPPIQEENAPTKKETSDGPSRAETHSPLAEQAGASKDGSLGETKGKHGVPTSQVQTAKSIMAELQKKDASGRTDPDDAIKAAPPAPGSTSGAAKDSTPSKLKRQPSNALSARMSQLMSGPGKTETAAEKAERLRREIAEARQKAAQEEANNKASAVSLTAPSSHAGTPSPPSAVTPAATTNSSAARQDPKSHPMVASLLHAKARP